LEGVGVRQTFSDARGEVVERIDFVAVDPEADARGGQGFDEGIDLGFVAAGVGDEERGWVVRLVWHAGCAAASSLHGRLAIE
jgi:hypothetical protein